MNDELNKKINHLRDLGVYDLILGGPEGTLLAFPEKPRRVIVHSIGKSIFSLGLYFAVHEGAVSLNGSIYDLLEEQIRGYHLPHEQEAKLKQIRYHHLLSMTMGQEHDFLTGTQRPYIDDNDWIRQCLEIPIVNNPGEAFLYSDMCMYLAGKIVQKRTDENLVKYLYPRLFEPLGIHMPTWEIDPQGDCITCGGLLLSAPEVQKFGTLIVNDGAYDGVEIVPSEWIREITSAKTIVNESTGTEYGYGIWRKNEYPYMFGYGGKYCLTDPKNGTVITAFSDNTETSDEVLSLLVDIADVNRGTVLV